MLEEKKMGGIIFMWLCSKSFFFQFSTSKDIIKQTKSYSVCIRYLLLKFCKVIFLV